MRGTAVGGRAPAGDLSPMALLWGLRWEQPEHRFWGQDSWVLILAPPDSRCSLGDLLPLFGPVRRGGRQGAGLDSGPWSAGTTRADQSLAQLGGALG